MMSGVEFGKVAKDGACDAVFWKNGDVCSFFLCAGNCRFDSFEIFFDLEMKNAILDDGDAWIHTIFWRSTFNFC